MAAAASASDTLSSSDSQQGPSTRNHTTDEGEDPSSTSRHKDFFAEEEGSLVPELLSSSVTSRALPSQEEEDDDDDATLRRAAQAAARRKRRRVLMNAALGRRQKQARLSTTTTSVVPISPTVNGLQELSARYRKQQRIAIPTECTYELSYVTSAVTRPLTLLEDPGPTSLHHTAMIPHVYVSMALLESLVHPIHKRARSPSPPVLLTSSSPASPPTRIRKPLLAHPVTLALQEWLLARKYAFRHDGVLKTCSFSESRLVLWRLACKVWPGPVRFHVVLSNNNKGPQKTHHRSSTSSSGAMTIHNKTKPIRTQTHHYSHGSMTSVTSALSLASSSSSSSSSSSPPPSPTSTTTTNDWMIASPTLNSNNNHSTSPPSVLTSPTTTTNSTKTCSQEPSHVVTLRCPESHPLTRKVFDEYYSSVTKDSPSNETTTSLLLMGHTLQCSKNKNDKTMCCTHANHVQQQQQPSSHSSKVDAVLKGEEQLELFAIPTCHYQEPCPTSVWIHEQTRTITLVRSSTCHRHSKNTQPRSSPNDDYERRLTVESLQQALTYHHQAHGKKLSVKERAMETVLAKWRVNVQNSHDQEEV